MSTIASISFFGCACGQKGEAHYDGATETARLVAASGRRVVNGGGPGVMLAATMGAEAGGGQTTAVYYRPEIATMFNGEVAANYADETFEEANYVLRTKKLLELGNAYIIFNGGTGTISEFGMAWGLARLYFGHHRPLILYGDFWQGVMDAFKKNMLVRPEEYEVFTIVRTPEEVLAAVEKYEKVLEKNHHEHTTCKNSECFFLM
mgnify:CR=1 FL=1